MRRTFLIARAVWLEMLRKKDVYVLLFLLVVSMISLMSLNFFGVEGEKSVNYIKDFGLLFAWIFSWVLSIMVTARQLPGEEKAGTIFPLLAKPVTRFQVLLGKLLGCWLTVASSTLFFYLVTTLVVWMRGGKEGLFYEETLLQSIILHFFAIGIICSISLFLSTRMNFDAAATSAFVFTIAAYVVAPRVPEMMVGVTGWRSYAMMYLYHLLPHFEFFDMRQILAYEVEDEPIKWHYIAIIAGYGLVHIAAYLGLAWLGFRNRLFKRGAAT